MFGSMRLILALCVAYSHYGISLQGRHIGVFAVVIFYMLAGFITSAQWDHYRSVTSFQKGVLVFFRDRALRLLPLYYASLAVSISIILGTETQTYFSSRAIDAECVMSNIAIIPLNYFSFSGIDHCTWVPPSWSLALEMQFYLLAPLIIMSHRLIFLMGFASLSIYMVANSGVINTDIYGYRLLPGTFFMFIIGGMLQKYDFYILKDGAVKTLWTLWGLFVASFLLVYYSDQVRVPFALETLSGLIIGMPAVALMKRLRRQNWDNVLGNIAFPVFLIHFPIIWLLGYLLGPLGVNIRDLALYTVTVLISATILWVFVDRPVSHYRRKIRVY